MLGKKISTEWPIQKYCIVQFVPHASQRKDQPEITIEHIHKNNNLQHNKYVMKCQASMCKNQNATS